MCFFYLEGSCSEGEVGCWCLRGGNGLGWVCSFFIKTSRSGFVGFFRSVRFMEYVFFFSGFN